MRKLLSLLLVLVLSSVVAGAAISYTTTRAKLRGSGGSTFVDGQELNQPSNKLYVSIVKRNGVCYSIVNLVTKGESAEQKLFFRLRLKQRDGCELSSDEIHLQGEAYISYRAVPRVIRRPLVNSNGRIFWVRDVLGVSRRLSEQLPVTLDYDGETITISSLNGFFHVWDMQADSYKLRRY